VVAMFLTLVLSVWVRQWLRNKARARLKMRED